jgi:predicted negative regulator of RcsB-dependent stress response
VDLLSEEEQWERLKAWLRSNGPSVLVLTALMLLGWFGWKWWQGRAEDQAAEAKAAYDNIVTKFDAGLDDDGFVLIETLRGEHPKSPYVAAADLIAANVHVSNNELDRALERLQRVATTAKDEYLRPIARLRLARVQAAQEQYDTALATLGTEDMGVHEAARLEIRGDVLLAKGDRDGALKEYQASRQLLPPAELEEGGVGELLDLKIADLGGTPPPSATEPEEAPEATTPAPAAEPTP